MPQSKKKSSNQPAGSPPAAEPIRPENLTYGRMPRVSKAPSAFLANDFEEKIVGFIEDALNTKPEVLKAEDCFRPGMDNLAEMIKPLPNSPLVLESGTAEKRTDLSIPFNDTRVCAATLPGRKKANGGYPENKDGVVLATSPDKQELSIFLAHSAGYEPEDAALANAEAITAAYETLEHPAAKLPDIFRAAEKQARSVSDELGAGERPEMIAGRLSRDVSGFYDLEISSSGNQICLVFHENTLSHESFHGKKEDLTDANIDAVAQSLGKNFSFQRIAELVESEEDPLQRAQMKSKLEEQFKNGPSHEVLRTMAERTLRAPSTANLLVAPGEIVLFTSQELVDSYGGVDKFINVVRNLIKSGPYTIEQVVKILVDDAEKDQKDDKLPDMSVSLVAFRAPKNLTE